MGKIFHKFLAAVLILMALAGFLLGGRQLFFRSYVRLGGELYSRNAEELVLTDEALKDLDALSGMPRLRQADLRRTSAGPEDYDRVRSLVPGCTVLWELPFQGQKLPLSTRELTVTSLTAQEAGLLTYLPKLETLHALGCPDYEVLDTLRQSRSGLDIQYTIPVNGEAIPWDAEELVLTDSTDLSLGQKLPYFPNLRRVRFEGKLPEAAYLKSLAEDCPRISFTWPMTLGGVCQDVWSREIDLTDLKLEDFGELDRRISYFPHLEILRLGSCGLPEEALAALQRGHPEVKIVYDISFGTVTAPMDARELVMTGNPLCVEQVEKLISWFPELERLDLVGCGLKTADVVPLTEKYPDIRFIWEVNLGGVYFRTDSTYFMPNKTGMVVTDQTIEELQYCVDMIGVDVGHMKKVTHCRWAANMPKLKYLVLADTGITDISPLAGLENLCFLELFLTFIEDYTPLLQCPGLEDLNLSYTYGSVEPVLKMHWLHKLWWTGSYAIIDEDMRRQLQEAMPDAELNFTTPSSTGGSWRKSQNYYDMRDLMGIGYMVG